MKLKSVNVAFDKEIHQCGISLATTYESLLEVERPNGQHNGIKVKRLGVKPWWGQPRERGGL